MKRVLPVIVLMLMAIGLLSTSTYAQPGATPETDSPTSAAGESSWARGFDTPASLFSERGDVIATVAVTDVERSWQDYAEFYEPSAGKEYVAVTVEVTMESRGSLLLSAFGFTLLDGYGYINYAAYVEADPLGDQEVLLEDISVASGETVTVTIIFEVFEDAPLGFLMWQPEFEAYALIDFTDEDI